MGGGVSCGGGGSDGRSGGSLRRSANPSSTQGLESQASRNQKAVERKGRKTMNGRSYQIRLSSCLYPY